MRTASSSVRPVSIMSSTKIATYRRRLNIQCRRTIKGTCLIAYITYQQLHSLRRILGLAIALFMNQGKFDPKFVCDRRDPEGSYISSSWHNTRLHFGPAYLFAPPASGLTMILSFQPSMCVLINDIIKGSEKRFSAGMSKKP